MSTALATAPLWEVHDPLLPDWQEPTPDTLVATLSAEDRRRRVLALIEQSHSILAEALAAHAGGREIVATCLLWSGGNDSTTLAHLMRPHATHVVHANTGIGIEATRRFVRDTAAAWGLPLIEKHPPPGSTYRDFVLQHGFPGPGQHHRMYQRLKERALRQARAELVTNGHRQRVVFLAGRRRAESRRRATVPLHEREDSIIWVSPIALWTKLDINTYRAMHPDLPRNEVCDHLHMSGECLCGSFAKPRELDHLRSFYPHDAAAIDNLETDALAAGIPEPRCRWGWAATHTTPSTHTDQPVGRLCSSCPPPPEAHPMRTGVDTALTAINHALGPDAPNDGCHQCGTSLDGSPSAEFCSEDCQHAWHQDQSGTAPSAGPAAPDESLPETTPARPLGWLGPPPAGAIVRPGHEVLDAVCAFVGRYSVFPSEHCAPTLALWYAHTHATDQFYVTPRLILDSAEPGSGKTRVLEVAQYLVAAPEMTISATTAALFRLVSMGPITILFDEVDAIFNPKNGGNNEDLRGLLNAGYKRSATIARCVGDAKNMKVQRFPVYAPAALAGIAGGMPATITTRAITIHMRRRRADEPVHPFRERQVAHDAQPLRDELAGWIESTATRIGDAQPEMPDGVTDRPAEIWEPLLAIADTAGGHWPATARAACRHFVLDTGPQITSLGVRLLADLRHVFTTHGVDRMTTADILTELHDLEESNWADLHGKPLDARRLGRELSKYGVRSKDIKINGHAIKGYRTDGEDGLADAWSRYLQTAATAATTATPQLTPVADTNPVADTAATHPTPQVADTAATPQTSATGLTSQVAAVAAVADETREGQ